MINMNEYKEKTKEELVEELHSLLKERFDLRIQRGSGLSPKPHLFKINKKNIARVKTILVEKNK